MFFLKGGNNQEYVVQVEWVLTHGGCGRKVNSQHKQLNYSFIINTYVHPDILHMLFLCSLCLWVLGGAAWLERPQHLLAAQTSPLHHQLLSIYCEGKRTTTTMIHQSWRVGKGFTANLRQTHVVTFSRNSEVILQHCFFFWNGSSMGLLGVKSAASAWPFLPIQTHFIPSPALSGKCCLQAKLFYRGAKSLSSNHHHWIQNIFLQISE